MIEWRRKNIWDKLDAIAQAKGRDYSGDSKDTFENIRLVETTMNMPAEVGIMVRLQDKLIRGATLLTREWKTGGGPAVKDESLTDTLMDAINYLSYIIILREERKRGGKLS
jgi:hypothetical protein